MIVTDVNDEVPVFQNLPYRVDLSEVIFCTIVQISKILILSPLANSQEEEATHII